MAVEGKSNQNRSDAVALLFADTMAKLTEHGEALERAEKERKGKGGNKNKGMEPPVLDESGKKEKTSKKDKKREEEKPSKDVETAPEKTPEKREEPPAPEPEISRGGEPDIERPEEPKVKELDIKEEIPPRDTVAIPKEEIPIPVEMEDDSPDIYKDEEGEEPTAHNKHYFNRSSKKLGEEITREAANEITGKKKSYKGTIIIHKKVVDTEGNPVDEDKISKKEKPEGYILIRKDTGEVFDINKNLSIGRDIDNDIVIANPVGHYVSGHQADIYIDGKDIWLEDAKSTNGTFVNGSKIKKKRLYAGNTVKFADIEFSFEER